MTRSEHHVMGVEPVVVTFYASSGRVLMRSAPLRNGMGVNVPKELRKRVARAETMDARGVVIDTWTAPRAVDEATGERK